MRAATCTALLCAVLVPAPREARAQCTDTDGDGLCDVDDPCLSTVPAPFDAIKEPLLTLHGLDDATARQRFQLKGTLLVPDAPAIDPAANGIRVVLREWFVAGAPLFDAVVPGGAEWTVRPGGQWAYRDPTGQAGGVTRVTIRRVLSPPVPAYSDPRLAYAIVVEARAASLALVDVLGATVSLAAAALNGRQCADALFADVLPWHCTPRGSGRNARCGGARRFGACRVSDPSDMVVCDALGAAAAEDAYFAQNGAYLAGSCMDLPGFVPTPGVTCLTALAVDADGSPGFEVSTLHPQASWSCTWFSDPAAGNPKLSCS
jgi:hypothetical protein